MKNERILSSSIATTAARFRACVPGGKFVAAGLGLGLSLAMLTAEGVAQTTQTWTQASADNNWNLSSTNWDAGLTWTQSNNATFAGAGEYVTLNQDAIIFNDLNFNVTGYTLGTGAGSLVLGNDLASTVTVATGTASILETMANSVNGSSALLKLGTGALTLGGVNTYSGVTTIGAGTVNVSVINGAGQAGNLGTAATIRLGNAADGGTLNYTGAGETIDRVIDLSGTTGGGGISQSGIGGTLRITSALTASGAGAKTLTLSGSTTGVGEFAGAIVDNSVVNTTGLTKSGSGMWTLSGNNTYSGLTTVNGGVLRVTHANSLGSTVAGTVQTGASEIRIEGGISIGAEAISIAGGGIGNAGALRNFSGDNTYAGTMTLTAQSRIVSDSGTFRMTGANAVAGANQNLIISGAGNIRIEGNIDLGSGFITKDNLIAAGTGTLTYAGTNSYTGATTVSAGTLQLDYATNDTTKLSDIAALNLGGGNATRLELTGGTHAEEVSSVVLLENSAPVTIARLAGNATLNMNVVTPNRGSSMIFTDAGIATSDLFPINGVLGFWARTRIGGVSAWATSAGGDNSPIVAFNAYTDVNRLGGVVPNDALAHVRIVDGGTVGGVTLAGPTLTEIHSLQVDASAGPIGISFANSFDQLTVGDDVEGAIWLTEGAGALTIGSIPGEGQLSSGGISNGLEATLRIINDSTANAITINSPIINNGFETIRVNASGAGRVVLVGANSFTGALTVSGGSTVVLTGDNFLRPNNVSGATVVANGGVLQVQANTGNTLGGVSSALGSETVGAVQPFLIQNGGTFQMRADEDVTFSGGNNFGGIGAATVTIDVNQLTAAGTGRTITFAPGGFNVGNTAINFTGGNGYRFNTGNINNVSANGTTTLNANGTSVTIGGFTAGASLVSILNLGGTSTDNVIVGAVSNPPTANATSVGKLGSGTWELAGANTHTGTTTVREGTLILSGERTAASGAFTVGDTAGLNAVLNITAGNFSMGSSIFIVSNQTNTSTVNHSNANISFAGGTQLIVGNVGVGSVGIYNLSSGSLAGAGSTTRGVILGTNNGTTGIFNLSGTGVLAMGNSNMQVGRSDTAVVDSTGIFNQTGGEASIGTLTVAGGAGGNFSRNSGTLNLTGGTFSVANFTTFGASKDGTATLLIGGTAQVTLPAFPNVRGDGATTTVTFDGGTLTPAGASAVYMGNLTNAFLTANGAKFNVPISRDITISQPLTNATAQVGTLTKLGAGTLTLTGANTYSGTTTVSAGGLIVNGTLGAGAVSVESGALFGGTATIGGTVSGASGATIVPGGRAAAGTLTVAGLTLVDGVSVEFELGGTSDLINVTGSGGLDLGGGSFSIFNTGGMTPFSTNGTYTLIDYTGALGGSTANISIGNAQAGKFYSIDNDAVNTLVTLTIQDATVTEWTGPSGSWTVPANWTAGVPNAAGAVAKFGTIPTTPTNVSVDGPKTVGGIVFENTNTFTITGAAGDTITLSNGIATAGINVVSGSHVINAPIILATDTLVSTAAGTTMRLGGSISGSRALTTSGSGTTILVGANSHGATNVSSGTLQVGESGTSGTLGAGDVSVSDGATLIFNRSDDITVANDIDGVTGKVTKQGAGTLTLSGTNTFGTTGGGVLNLNAGRVRMGTAGALGAGVRLAFAGGELDLNGFDLTLSSIIGSTGRITDLSGTAGTSTVTMNVGSAMVYGGTIEDGTERSIALIKNGGGALTLSGDNSYTGSLLITNGAVIGAGTGGATPIAGDVTLGNGTNTVFLIAGALENQFSPTTVLTFANSTTDAKFQLRGSNVTLAGIQSAPTTTLSIIQNDEVGTPGFTAAPGIATLTLNTVADYSFTGLIRNQAGGALNLVKEGPGTQEIRNVAVVGNTFGDATINEGKLTFNFAGATGTLGGGTSIVLGPNGTLGLDGNWNMGRPIFGSGKVQKDGTGTVTLSGLNSHTGDTVVSQGTLIANSPGIPLPGRVVVGAGNFSDVFLVMGAVNQFGLESVVKFDNGSGRNAKMELRGFDQTVAGLESDADDTLSIVQNQEAGTPVSATLTINATTDHVFNGIVRTQAGGALNLVKTGAGTQEFRNVAAQGYGFGTAAIDQGRLTLNFSGATATLGAATTFTVAAGASLGLDGTWTMNRDVFGAGDLVKLGNGTVNLTNVPAHTGATLIEGGTLVVSSGLNGTSRIDMRDGGTLAGTGFIAPAVSPTGSVNLLVGGRLSPGDPAFGFPGTLTLALGGGKLDLSAGVAASNTQSLLFDLDAIVFSDLVSVQGGAIDIGTGGLAFNDFVFTAGFGLEMGTYTLFDGDTALIGSLDPNAANLTGPIGGMFGTVAIGGGGNDIVLVVVPEPGTAAGLLLGLGALLGRRRRKR